MDITTVLGLALGFGSMMLAIFVEGRGDITEFQPFFSNISAWIIILGGTFGATMLSSKKRDIASMGKAFSKIMKDDKIDYTSSIKTIISMAEKARREGLIALEEDVQKVKHPILKSGLSLVIDGVEPEIVEAILITKLAEEKNKVNSEAGVFECMGGFAPTMGIIGTVMGLVGTLRRMSSAGMERTVESLAVAFIATFWGIATANLLFLPIAGKLRARWKDEHILIQIIMEGILCIQQGNNPHIVEQRLTSFLSTSESAKSQPEQEEALAR